MICVLWDFLGLKLILPFKINISCRKQPSIQIGIHGTDRHNQFQMIALNEIGRLSLLNQRGIDRVFLMELPLSHVDSSSGIPEFFTILLICKPSIVIVFVSDHTK